MSTPIDGLIISPVGSAPLIANLCDELDLSGIVDRIVRWDSKQRQTSHGTLIKGLVVNLLTLCVL